MDSSSIYNKPLGSSGMAFSLVNSDALDEERPV